MRYLETLLRDRTTGENIIWATDDYSSRGDGFYFYDSITIDKICGGKTDTLFSRVYPKSPEGTKETYC